MPNYDFRCPICQVVREVFQNVHEDHVAVCPRCRESMTRVYREMNFVSSSFKSGRAFDPSVGHDRPYHGGHFDLAAGRWFNDKNERARWMRSKGLKEVGTDWDKRLALKDVKDEKMIQQRVANPTPHPRGGHTT